MDPDVLISRLKTDQACVITREDIAKVRHHSLVLSTGISDTTLVSPLQSLASVCGTTGGTELDEKVTMGRAPQFAGEVGQRAAGAERAKVLALEKALEAERQEKERVLNCGRKGSRGKGKAGSPETPTRGG